MGFLFGDQFWLGFIVSAGVSALLKRVRDSTRAGWKKLRGTPIAFWIGLLLSLAFLYSAAPKIGGPRLRLLTYAICGLACVAMWRRKPLASEWRVGSPGPEAG